MLAFSVLMLYSTTAVIALEKYSDELFFVKRQVFAGILGIIGLVFTSFLSIRFLYKISKYLFIIAIILLTLVFIPGLAKKAGGATRWVYLLGFGFQPAEFVKLCFILFVAGYFSRHEANMKSFTAGILKPFVCVGFLAFLLLLQPDFGTSAVLAGITLCLVIVMGARFSHIAACMGFLILTMSALVYTSPYRMKRLVAFLDPFEDQSGSGYQLIQSLIAVASGKLTGMGLGSSQQKLYYLPAAHTDFIYAIIAEELGFLGAFLILFSFLVFLALGLHLAKRLIFDSFAYSLCIGLTLLICMPAFINVGVVTGMLPTKGLVLPLVGYGGTCVLVSLTAIGILLSLIKYSRKHERHIRTLKIKHESNVC
ncbi:UNVERIFIED_CONTAM: hypothetical protein GTU68_011556 [Idotea baltica]|nr:hypothetical protein [Idotea baltica]